MELFELVSPCIGICQSDARGYCLGCLRSRQERFNWQKMTSAEQQEVLRLCRNRKARVEAARRKAREGEPPEAPAQPDLDF